MDKLLIPIFVGEKEQNWEMVGHWILLCCHMKSRTLCVYDSDRNDNIEEARKEVKWIIEYFWEESQHVPGKQPGEDHAKYVNSWTIDIKPAPQQDEGTMDCGVFMCCFMDFLLLNLPISALTHDAIKEHGRKWLFMSICRNEILLDK